MWMPGPWGGSHGTQFAFGFERLEPQMDDILMTGKSLTHKRKMSKQIIFFILNVVYKKVLQLIVCLHLTLISASSSLTPTNITHPLSQHPSNLLFGLLLILLPASSNLSVLLPI